MTVYSQNGWPANDPTLVSKQRVNGTDCYLTVRKDAPGLLLLEVAEAYNREVEPLSLTRGAPDDWSYSERPIRGGWELSNHASGTAVDFNATLHPLGYDPRASFSTKQIFAIDTILVVCKGVVRWGGNYTGRKDGMHWEINDRQTVTSCERALTAMQRYNGGDQLSAQFEADARMRWPKEDTLEHDLRTDLHYKQVQIDELVKYVHDVDGKLDRILKLMLPIAK